MEVMAKYVYCPRRKSNPRISKEVCQSCQEDCEFAQATEALSLIEKTELEQLENVIEKNLRSFYEVGSALLAIRDGRLYRDSYGTFGAYCRDKWDMSRIHAHRLIESVKAQDNLLPMGNIFPSNERQLRPLTKLEPEQQVEVWQKAVETAPEGKVTARHVAKTGKELYPPEPKPEKDYGIKPKCEVSDAMSFAVMAITDLERIKVNDPEREEALLEVRVWIDNQLTKEA